MYMYMYEQSKYCEFPLESRVFIRAIVRIPLWHFDQRMSLETEGFHSSSFLCSFFFFFISSFPNARRPQYPESKTHQPPFR